jgi:hypothetical protein
MHCPFSDGNSCMQYNCMKQFCQDCPMVNPELINTPERKAKLLMFHGHVATKCGKDSSCTDKKKYHTYAGALKATQEVKEKGADKEAYPCPWCYSWHIGRRMSTAELMRFM